MYQLKHSKYIRLVCQRWLDGFSLIELMVAITVIGILVALAMPRYRLYIATSRQAEAHANLGLIASLQQTYQLKHNGKYYDNSSFQMGLGGGGTCSDTVSSKQNNLGFRVSDCERLRYTYSVGGDGAGTATNDGSDSSRYIYPDCAQTDTWGN